MFRDNSFHGRGVLRLNNETVVIGEWVNGLLEGDATVEWGSGEKFKGKFVSNMR